MIRSNGGIQRIADDDTFQLSCLQLLILARFTIDNLGFKKIKSIINANL